MEVEHILLETGGHVFNLNQLVAIVFVEDASGANRIRARFAKVLHLLVDVSRARCEHGPPLAHQADPVVAQKLRVVADRVLVLGSQMLGMLHYLQQLLVLVKLLEVFGLDWLFAGFVGALLGVGGKDVRDAELAEGVAAVRHDDWLALVEGVGVLAPVALEKVLHLLKLLNQKLKLLCGAFVMYSTKFSS